MADILQLFPWAVAAIIFLSEKAIQWRMIGVFSSVLERLTAPTAAPIPPAPVPQPAPAPIAPPAPAPAPPKAPPPPSGPFPGAPSWFLAAVHEIGFHETGNNQGIDRYIQLAHAGSPGDPWCAIFANAMLESSGIPGTRSASSQSFRNHPNFVKLDRPALGCIVVFWRGTPNSGLGHVGFYRGEDASRVWTLGGNESDMVQIEALAKNSASFGLEDYWWPAHVALPTGGPVMMPAGSPTSVQTPPTSAPAAGAAPNAIQKGITATMFGGQQSAYGGPIIDSQPGVALPFRFTGARPRVRVTKGGASVDCDVVDVGPWNINDPYWETGARPQAETGTDTTGRHTNKAGIDLTLAAAQAIQLDGKGLVDWQFITSPASAAPAVT